MLDWMTFLGLRTGMLAKRLGLSHSAIDVAGIKGCRGSRWLPALSQLVHVPVDILMDTSPEDPAAGEYQVPALLRAADIRMRRYRFERQSPPHVTRHQSGGDAPAFKRGASKPTTEADFRQARHRGNSHECLLWRLKELTPDVRMSARINFSSNARLPRTQTAGEPISVTHIQGDLFDLSARFERMTMYFEAQQQHGPARDQGKP